MQPQGVRLAKFTEPVFKHASLVFPAPSCQKEWRSELSTDIHTYIRTYIHLGGQVPSVKEVLPEIQEMPVSQGPA